MRNEKLSFDWTTVIAWLCILVSPFCWTESVTLASNEATENTAAPATQRPNIVFVIADDMHRHMFNCLPEGRRNDGQPKNLTPNLDRLASGGTVMMGQYVSSPVCTPSRYSCLTGLYASRSQAKPFLRDTQRWGQTVVQWNSFITDEKSLVRRLQDAGYTTAMVGKNHVFDAPFKKIAYDADPSSPSVITELKLRQKKFETSIKSFGFDYVAGLYNENPDGNGPRALAVHNLDWIADGAVQFIQQQANANSGDDPFFLYLATTIPHGPGEPARSWKADPKIVPYGYLEQPPKVLPPRDTIPSRISAAGLRSTSSACNLLWLDDLLGAVLDSLEQAEQLDNTIIVFFNDHGQQAKGTLYQGGVSNPSLIWTANGFACGSENDSLVSNIDFTPTLLHAAGVDYDAAEFDGRSFWPILQGQTDSIHDSLFFEMGFSRAVLADGWKYLALRYPPKARDMSSGKRAEILKKFNQSQERRGRPVYTEDPTTPFSHVSLIPGGGDAEAMSTGMKSCYYDADQLFDLNTDPDEQHNLADSTEAAQQLDHMQRLMSEYLQSLPGSFAELKPE